jgi:hypothetical protein
MKKKSRRFALKIYWYGALLLVFVSLFRKYKEKCTKEEAYNKMIE